MTIRHVNATEESADLHGICPLPKFMTVIPRHSCESRNLDPRFRGDDGDRLDQNF